MKYRSVFTPPLRLGLVTHGVAIALLAIAGGAGIWMVFRVAIGPLFLLFLLLAVLAASQIPVLAYRAYALRRAYYLIERDGLRLHWGLRTEDIPMSEVLWARPGDDHQMLPDEALPMPWLRWPGAILGVRRLANGVPIEFMAASTSNLVLIATSRRVFAISPDDPQEFMLVYYRLNELGSIFPIPAQSTFPSFLLGQVWSNRAARIPLLAGLAMSLALLGWTSLIIPTRSTVYLSAFEEDPAPAVQLLLLPLINSFFFLANLVLGLFLYRRSEARQPSALDSAPPGGIVSRLIPRVLSYIVWGASLITTTLFLAAVYFIQLYG
ncbi:MAG: PH domain-containing protein [Anaerolineales bacterium]|nr:PH domain-containing protein [Anaerolineales bacterium]